MPAISYETFNIEIRSTPEEGKYQVFVRGASGGDANGKFSIDEVGLKVFKPLQSDGAPKSTRNIAIDDEEENGFLSLSDVPQKEMAKNFGARLYKAVFKDEVEKKFIASLKIWPRQRIRFDLTDVPELAGLPWEYLHDVYFLAESINTPIVRYLQGGEIQELAVKKPLRVLLMFASPKGLRQLAGREEWEKIKQELKDQIDKGLVELDILEASTYQALQEKLLERLVTRPYHIFHFIGHGNFDGNAGYLAFEDKNGDKDLVSGETVSTLLRDTGTLRLAVINACEGARVSNQNSYSGLAQSLLQQTQLPAAIGMQFEITDRAAIQFAESFYSALAKDFPIDAALTEARKSIIGIKDCEREWGTPVLYMRSSDGYIFTASARDEKPQVTDDLSDAVKQMLADCKPHFQAVIRALMKGALVPFIGLDANLLGRKSLANWEMKDGLPGGEELTAYLAKKFEFPGGDRADIAAIAQYVNVEKGGLGEIYDEFANIFTDDLEPTALHQLFAQLPDILAQKEYQRPNDPIMNRYIVVTASYDNLLEKAFNQYVKNYHLVSYSTSGKYKGKYFHYYIEDGQKDYSPVPIESASDYKGFAKDQLPTIIKLPGTLENRELAITEDHYFDYLTHQNFTHLLPPQLTTKLKWSSHLFIGYSLRDWNWRALLYRIWDEVKTNRESWAVHPQIQHIDEQFWKTCNVQVLNPNLKDYILALRESVKRF